MGLVRVGIIQSATKKLAISHNCEISSRLIKKAARHGAQIVVTPECMLDGYSFDTKEFQANPDQYSFILEDSIIKQYCDLATALNVHCIIGLSLKGGDAGKKVYWNAAVLISAAGSIQGTYYKTHSTYQDAESKFYKWGEEYPVFKCAIREQQVPIGIMICYDRQLPEPARILRVKGASIIFNPAATMNFWMGWNTRLIQTRAFENKCYIVSVNHAFPRLCGRSFVVNPKGKIIARLPIWQSVRVVTIDLDMVERQKHGVLTRRPATYQDLVRQMG